MAKVLAAVFGMALIIFSVLSYKQNRVISLLNDEIVSQSQSRQRIMLERYRLKLQVDSLKASCQANSTLNQLEEPNSNN